MTRTWTLAESRLIAEKVMGWHVAEINGRLFLADSEQRPDWLPTCAIPDWPRDPAAAAMALAAMQKDGWRYEGFWALGAYSVRLIDPISKDSADRASRDWPEAVMLAILAAVRG